MRNTIVKSVLGSVAAAFFVFLAGCGMADSGKSMNDAYADAKNGKWDKVKVAAERRIKEVPTDNDARALLSLALFYTERDNPESMNRAKNYMRLATTAMPDRYDLAYVYGWILLNTGRYSAEAWDPLKKAYDMHLNEKASIGQETQGSIKYAIGIYCLRNSIFDNAEKYLSQASKSTPYSGWSRLYSDIAYSLVYRGKMADALQYLNKAFEVEKELARQRAEKLKELKKLQEDNAMESLISKKKEEIAKLAGDDKIYVTRLNMAVVCDYLSYPEFNAKSHADFRKSAPVWYKHARKGIVAAKAKAKNAKEQDELNKLLAEIDRRLAELAAR